MRAPRWWETGERSVEAEGEWFRESGLDFRLDQALFDAAEVVVFRGELRLDGRRMPAQVVYPPAYAAGEHPRVIAPELEIGRHRGPDGSLCLDHAVFGRSNPMYGAEAVERAERLWWLWENDREQLREEEADAPDPWANYAPGAPGTAIVLDVDATGYERGYLDLAITSLVPLRGAVTTLRATHPSPARVEAEATAPFAGGLEVNGVWRRLAAPPIASPTPERLADWLARDQMEMVKRAFKYARGHARNDMPAVIAFVYPDEGPNRGETHDAWLVFIIRPDQRLEIPHAFALREEERWLRQPQLEPLADKSVALVGAGALGAPIGGLLGRAGVGRIEIIDRDVMGIGNRVRHELDLGDLGNPKAIALQERIRRVNPWAEPTGHVLHLGQIFGDHAAGQRGADKAFELIAGVDLVVNASAHPATGYYLAGLARAAGKPVLHTWVSAGAWGARILIQRHEPDPSGCPQCLALWQESDSVEVPTVSSDPEVREVMERGCADPTFTGAGFDLTEAAAAATRVAVQLLCAGEGESPPADFDLLTLDFRNETAAMTKAYYTRLPVHPRCPCCRV